MTSSGGRVKTNTNRFACLFTAALLALLASGCVQFISNYDEQTDRSVTALQKKMETFFVKLEGQAGLPECVYDKHKSFYEEAKVDVSGLKLRVEAIPQNTITSEQILLLERSLSTLEALHKTKSARPLGENCLSVAEIQPLRANFNISFTSILKLELAKKRGEKKSA
jgi:hypothetical protein